MTEFTFWVNVKIPDDCNISAVMSARPSEVKALPDGHTKDSVAKQKEGVAWVQQLMSKPVSFGAMAQGRKISIICADDVYYNLEALRIVFTQLGLANFCHFVNNG